MEPKKNGILKCIADLDPFLPIVVTTSQANVQSAVFALQNGVQDYIEKSVLLQNLESYFQEILGLGLSYLDFQT